MSSESRGAARATAHCATARRAAAILLAFAMVGVAACGDEPATPTPPRHTAVPIGATAWPSGTVGQYGLRIDPSLLGRLPASVAALPLKEDAASESGALDNAELPGSFDGYAAASIGMTGDPDFLNLVIGRRRPEKLDADFYTAWVEEYATGACSHASGVASSDQQTIDDMTVDVSTCNGGPVVYTLSMEDGLLLSMWGMGPRDLGRKLIESLR